MLQGNMKQGLRHAPPPPPKLPRYRASTDERPQRDPPSGAKKARTRTKKTDTHLQPV